MPTTQTKAHRSRIRFERLEARISPEQKALFKRAASLEGRSLTDFVIDSVAREAKRVVKESETMVLGERDRRAFVQALMKPSSPNKALRNAVRRHAVLTGRSR